MIRNVLLITVLVLIGFFFIILVEATYLIPYKPVLRQSPYPALIATYTALLFLNTLAVIYLLYRHVFLKDTGRKLAHIEKQFQNDHPSLRTELDVARQEE